MLNAGIAAASKFVERYELGKRAVKGASALDGEFALPDAVDGEEYDGRP
ncbi:hypothetical protein [Rubrobacter marinus]|nr:hypothetical protein [Rubrobacter marinus]